MNRQLKFRVWNKATKRFFKTDYNEHLSVAISVDGKTLYQNYVGGDKEIGKDVIIQQFTGLKDKNEKMIFEGDILRQNDLRFEIRFELFQWVAVCPYYNKYHHPRIEHFRLCVSGEVVGNIFENPELLKR